MDTKWLVGGAIGAGALVYFLTRKKQVPVIQGAGPQAMTMGPSAAAADGGGGGGGGGGFSTPTAVNPAAGTSAPSVSSTSSIETAAQKAGAMVQMQSQNTATSLIAKTKVVGESREKQSGPPVQKPAARSIVPAVLRRPPPPQNSAKPRLVETRDRSSNVNTGLKRTLR